MSRTASVVGSLIAVVLFGLAVAALAHFLRGSSLREVLAAALHQPRSSLLLAVLLTAVSYLVLTGYDVLALRYVGHRHPYRRTALVSFISYALSHNLGMTLLSGGSSRYRLYSSRGLSALDATRVVLFCNLTFWVGFLFLGGAVLTFRELPIPENHLLSSVDTRPLGLACLAATAILTAWVASGRGEPSIRGHRLRLPALKVFLGQLAVAAADWSLAAAVPFVLFPAGAVSYFDFLAIFLLAQVLAMASNVPGGMGVFESCVLFLAPPGVDAAPLLGSLLVYRVVYYLLPLAVAVPLLAAHEWRRHRAPRTRGQA